MKYNHNKLALAVASCFAIYSPFTFAGYATVSTENNLEPGKQGVTVATITFSNSDGANGGNTDSSNFICLKKNDTNLDFEQDDRVLIVKRKIDKGTSTIKIDNKLRLGAYCAPDGINPNYVVGGATCTDVNGDTITTEDLGLDVPLATQVKIETESTDCTRLLDNNTGSNESHAKIQHRILEASLTNGFTLSKLQENKAKIVYSGAIPEAIELQFSFKNADLVTGNIKNDNAKATIDYQPNTGPTDSRFIKLDANGNRLANQSATNHKCVLDNRNTSDESDDLIWEVKQTSGLHNADDTYTWFFGSDGSTIGNFNDGNSPACHGHSFSDTKSYCNTEAFTARVNKVGLCGSKNWRVPKAVELASIHDSSQTSSPYIDSFYFPNNLVRRSDSLNSDRDYWARELVSTSSNTAKSVVFHYNWANPIRSRGSVTRLYQFIRLVRNAQ